MSIRDAIRKKKNKSPLSEGLLSTPLFQAMEALLNARLDVAVKQVREEQMADFKASLAEALKDLDKDTAIAKGNIQTFTEKKASELDDHTEVLAKELNQKAIIHAQGFRAITESLMNWCKNQINLFFTDTSDRLDKLVTNIESMRGPKGDDGSPDTAEAIAKKLNTTTGSIKPSVIKGLEQRLIQIMEVAKKKGGGGKGGGGMGQPQHETKSVGSATTTVTTTYTIAAGGRAIWMYYQGQFLVYGTHYTVSGRTITLLFTPVDSTFIDITYLRG